MTNEQKKAILNAIDDIVEQLGLRCDECCMYEAYTEYRGICKLTQQVEPRSSYCADWRPKENEGSEENSGTTG